LKKFTIVNSIGRPILLIPQTLTIAKWNRIVKSAHKRLIPVTITRDYAFQLFISQQQKCALSGQEIFLSEKEKNTTASLDRIDSNQGYEIGNVQWVHKDLNIMKNQISEQEFKQFCKLVSEKENANIR